MDLTDRPPTWPGGCAAAVALSWDDGTVTDRRLVSLLNRYGIPATFFLNSGKLGLSAAESGFRDYVRAPEVRELYAGHEVGAHTVDHPDLLSLSDVEVRHQLAIDREALGELIGTAPTGFASPFGNQDARTAALVRAEGFTYQRGVGQHDDFTPPWDLWQWEPNTHCLGEVDSVLDAFLAAPAPTPAPRRLWSLWGHSWEIDDHDSWGALERLLARLAAADVWIATYAQVATSLQH